MGTLIAQHSQQPNVLPRSLQRARRPLYRPVIHVSAVLCWRKRIPPFINPRSPLCLLKRRLYKFHKHRITALGAENSAVYRVVLRPATDLGLVLELGNLTCQRHDQNRYEASIHTRCENLRDTQHRGEEVRCDTVDLAWFPGRVQYKGRSALREKGPYGTP